MSLAKLTDDGKEEVESDAIHSDASDVTSGHGVAIADHQSPLFVAMLPLPLENTAQASLHYDRCPIWDIIADTDSIVFVADPAMAIESVTGVANNGLSAVTGMSRMRVTDVIAKVIDTASDARMAIVLPDGNIKDVKFIDAVNDSKNDNVSLLSFVMA